MLITNLVMNTAQSHFNEDAMKNSPYGGRLSYGGVNFSLAMGLAMQDCGENALAELGMDNIRLPNPVVHGDTLYAYSEVLSAEDGDRDGRRHRHLPPLRREPGRQAGLPGRPADADQAPQPLGRSVMRGER